jgi:hypothetical protein
MGILEKVSQYQDYLVELASVFDSEFAEDIVQEFYLLLLALKCIEKLEYRFRTQRWYKYLKELVSPILLGRRNFLYLCFLDNL